MFPGNHKIIADEDGPESHSIDSQRDLDTGLPVDPINRHFAVRYFISQFGH